MQIRKHFVPRARSSPQGRLFSSALILSVVVTFVAPATPSSTTAVQADVAQDGPIYLPLIMQPPATGPVSVQVTLDPAHRVQQTVPPEGGTLNVTGADGTKFSLLIPDGSLAVTSTITMTVLSAIQGLPFGGGLAGAVHLEPQGLLFFDPAILTIEPAASVPPDQQTFFAYDGDGQEFRLHPPVFDEDNLDPIRLPVYHFSGVGMASGTEAERVALLQRTPSDVANQIRQQVAALVQRERAARRAGRPGDPQFWTKLEALARRYYSQVVQPTMQHAVTTRCHGRAGQHAVSDAISLALGWMKDFQLLGLGDTFMQAEQASVVNSVLQAFTRCWDDATKPCMDWKNHAQVVRVVSLAHQALMLGLSPDVFDPWRLHRCVGCEWIEVVSDWEGSVRFSYEQHSSRTDGGTTTADVARSATMNFDMFEAADWGGRQRWDASGASGSGNFNERVVYSSPFGSLTQTWIGSGQLKQLSPPTGHGKMAIDPVGCKYSVEFSPYIEVVYTSDSGEQSRLARNVGTPYLFELTLPDTAGRVLSGMLMLQASIDPMQAQNTFTHFQFSGTGAAAELGYALGKDNLGTAQVEWAVWPAPYE